VSVREIVAPGATSVDIAERVAEALWAYATPEAAMIETAAMVKLFTVLPSFNKPTPTSPPERGASQREVPGTNVTRHLFPARRARPESVNQLRRVYPRGTSVYHLCTLIVSVHIPSPIRRKTEVFCTEKRLTSPYLSTLDRIVRGRPPIG
jgi:hypothetical protein